MCGKMLPCAGRPVSRQAVRVQPSQAGFSRCDVHLVEGSSERKSSQRNSCSKASYPEAKLLTFFHFLVVSLDSIPQLLHAIGQARLARFGQRFQLPCNTHSSSASVFPQMGARQKAESISFHRQSPNSLDPERPSTYILFPPASF